LAIVLQIDIARQVAVAADPAKDNRTGRAAEVIRAGVLNHFPPHYLVDKPGGKPAGFAIEIMNAVAARAGLSVDYVVFPSWAKLNTALRQRQIDVIPNIGVTESRAKWAAFTVPVETFPVSIFVRETNHDITSADDLAGRHVSVRRENVGVSLMRKRGDVDLLLHDTWEQALLALLSGESDAFVYPMNVLFRLLRESKLEDQIRVIEPPLIEINRAIGVRPDRPKLFARLDQAVRQLVPAPEYQKIFTKWYGKPKPLWTAELLSQVLAAVLVAALFAIAVIAIWRSRSLARINARLSRAISERDNIAAQLRLHDRAIEYSSNGIVITDVQADDDPIIYVNPAFEQITGYPKEEMIGRNARFLQNDDRDQPGVEEIRAALREDRPVQTVLCNYRKDGTPFWDEIYISPVRDPDGTVTHYIGIHNDISDRVANDAALRSNRTLLQTMIASSPDAILTIDPAGSIETFNAAATSTFGYGAGGVIGKNIRMLMPDPYHSDHDGYLVRYLRTDEKRIIGIGREVQGKRRDGTIFPIELAVGEFEVEGQRRFTGFIRDISKRRHAEDDLAATRERVTELQSEFMHVSRLSAMGEMATTLAHELNQPLTAIASYVQACRRILQSDRSDKGPRAESIMAKVGDQSIRAGEIIRRLRTFVAQSETDRMSEEIDTVIEEACDLALIGASAAGVEVEKI
jgi:two-component system sensor kinase FixL